MSDVSASTVVDNQDGLPGRLRPTAGHIGAHPADVLGRGRAELAPFRRKLGMVLQMTALFDSLFVEENCAFPLVEHTNWRPA